MSVRSLLSIQRGMGDEPNKSLSETVSHSPYEESLSLSPSLTGRLFAHSLVLVVSSQDPLGIEHRAESEGF